MRKTIFALSAVVCLLFAGAARADLIYSLTLTPTSGGAAAGGFGSFEINTNTAPNGLQNRYTPTTGLVNISFTIGTGSNTETFDLTNATSPPLIEFTNGVLDDVAYTGTDNVSSVNFFLSSNGFNYTISNQTQTLKGGGTISLSSPTPRVVAPAPEPSSFILLGTSLFAGAGVFRRRLLA